MDPHLSIERLDSIVKLLNSINPSIAPFQKTHILLKTIELLSAHHANKPNAWNIGKYLKEYISTEERHRLLHSPQYNSLVSSLNGYMLSKASQVKSVEVLFPVTFVRTISETGVFDQFVKVFSNLKYLFELEAGKSLTHIVLSESVGNVALLLLDYLLGYPSTKLATFGPLRPNQEHHYMLSNVDGYWVTGTVCGVKRTILGLPMFHYSPLAPPVEVELFVSKNIQSFFPELDDFEGDMYDRILVPVQVNSACHVANLYAINFGNSGISADEFKMEKVASHGMMG